MSTPNPQPQSVTGVQLAQGVGHQVAQGFWADAWSQVLKRPAAIFGLSWIGIVSFFAVFAPLLASGHPWLMSGTEDGPRSPLIAALKSSDVIIIAWVAVSAAIILGARGMTVGPRLRLSIALGLQAAITVVLATVFASMAADPYAAPWLLEARRSPVFIASVATGCALFAAIPFILISVFAHRSMMRVLLVLAAGVVFGLIVGWKWTPALQTFDYRAREASGAADATYTVIPFSPNQSVTVMFNRPPGSTPMNAWWTLLERDTLAAEERLAVYSESELGDMAVSADHLDSMARASSSVADLLSVPVADVVAQARSAVAGGSIASLRDLRDFMLHYPAPRHLIGTDTLGQDVLSQMLHACRLAISIGFVSTGIAVVIGVTIGSIMGYFGGWIDLLLYRVVEIFMAVPVLFILIVVAGVLPRNIYVMMAILGCFTWTGAARFTRAEFMKLRNADYIQAARATGLPLWSILFKHMLPNGVTPVLVDTSFAIAAAILIEAVLSFLGLGPAGQASWGKLLSNAIGDAGGYMWWLAIFPGGAIFLTALSYNLIGEALRDAIDPKLKKARV